MRFLSCVISLIVLPTLPSSSSAVLLKLYNVYFLEFAYGLQIVFTFEEKWCFVTTRFKYVFPVSHPCQQGQLFDFVFNAVQNNGGA